MSTLQPIRATPAKAPLAHGNRGLLQCKSRSAEMGRRNASSVPSIVHDVARSPGRPLEAATRAFMEPRFEHDFSHVRVHTGPPAAESAKRINALAYTMGRDIVFGAGQYKPETGQGRELVAHELAHVVQQGAPKTEPNARPGVLERGGAPEAEADRAADAVSRGNKAPNMEAKGKPSIQRRVEMRDVGKGEHSGFARLPELITRLNNMSHGLTYSMNGKYLACQVKTGGTLSLFDTQMKGFIDQESTIPLRLTNRAGLLGNRASGFHDHVDVDAWTSGYVDIDDLLGTSSDLALQTMLAHFLTERGATSNYDRRIGTNTFTLPEFRRVHSLGIGAEEALLRDYFGDPTIKILNDSPTPTIRREFRNKRHDLIRRRVSPGRGAETGVDKMSIEVITRDGKKHTPEEYKRILEDASAGGPPKQVPTGGATGHEPTRSVPPH
jgi:Domain of unknown function (DUF4157)